MELSKREFLQAAGGTALLSALVGCRGSAFEQLCHPRVRRSVHDLLAEDANHPILVAYANGITAMRALPITDPTSWDYQAAIHHTNAPQNTWPAGAPWATCAHHQIRFLGWHRIYLLMFERIIAAKSNMPGFALPYWDYDGDVDHRKIPAPFRDTGSPLYDATRNTSLNNGTSAISAALTTAAAALAMTDYLGVNQFQYKVEQQPHDKIHDQISGNMGAFATAAKDPIFWFHHCNIDRLQEKWIRHQATHSLATAANDSAWMNQTLKFAKPDGSFVTYRAIDTFVPEFLGYVYDQDYADIRDTCRDLSKLPFLFSVRPPPDDRLPAALRARAEPRRRDIDLARETSVAVPLGVPALEALAQPAGPGSAFLVLDGLRAQAPPGVSFAVHVGTGAADAGVDLDAAAGFIGFFGRLPGEEAHGPPGERVAPPPVLIDLSARLDQPLRDQAVAARALPVRFTAVGPESPGRPATAARPAPGSAPFIGEASIVLVDNLPARQAR